MVKCAPSKISNLAKIPQTASRTPLQTLSKNKFSIFDVQKTAKANNKLSPLQNEFNQYKARPSTSELDPIQLWKINQQTYPCLFYCFKRLACVNNYFLMLTIIFGIGKIGCHQTPQKK